MAKDSSVIANLRRKLQSPWASDKAMMRSGEDFGLLLKVLSAASNKVTRYPKCGVASVVIKHPTPPKSKKIHYVRK